MNRKKVWGLALLSGAMLGGAWYPPLTFLIFAAWIPFFFLTDELVKQAKRPKGSAFLYSYITFVTWNTIATWWTCYASLGGCMAAVLANSLLMSLTYLLFFILYRRLRGGRSAAAALWLFVPIWLSFEYLHSLWELAWTWLTLGNVLAYSYKWIQWYEFTGVSGGSLWILAANVLIYQLVQVRAPADGRVTFFFKNKIPISGFILISPIVISRVILAFQQVPAPAKADQEIVIVQPNIDPYNDKFNGDYASQLQLAWDLARPKLNEKTNYLVLPETFFTETVWESTMEDSYSVKFLRDSILKKYPDLIIVTGASTFYHFKHGEKLSASARKYSDAEEYYDVFNTGLQLDNSGPIQVYHKSKLVPAVERMPYPGLLGFLGEWAIDLGGTSGSLGTQPERGVFFNKDKSVGVAPVICYESVFGEYVAEYFAKGANLIFIITNDGWWSDSPGYVQHLNYARLRAIETRTPIARCANTGISCFINERGELYQETKWWEPAAISASLAPNKDQTFFVKYGDLVSRAALILAGLSFFLLLIPKKDPTRN